MQSMQMLMQTELCTVKAQAICDQEGQVLFKHAAPLGLSVGDYVTDRMTAGERRFFLASSEADAICLCRSTALLCRRSVFDGMLIQCLPLGAPPRAVAAVSELARSLGLVLSPGLAALGGGDDPAAEVAAAELIGLCGIGAVPRSDSWPAERLLAHLAELPPICSRQLILRESGGICPGGVWPILLYGLAAFLCRSTDGSALRLALFGQPQLPMAVMSASAPAGMPPGRSRLACLAERFPEAPELALCSRLAAANGIAVEISADGAGQLSFAAEQRPDPALFGFKQPIGFTDEAGEAEEAKWCRLLRDAVQAGR